MLDYHQLQRSVGFEPGMLWCEVRSLLVGSVTCRGYCQLWWRTRSLQLPVIWSGRDIFFRGAM